MKRNVLLLTILGISVLSIGCTRPKGDASTVSIRTPSASSLFNKSSAQASGIPANKKLCFGVAVSGSGIDISHPADACGPEVGMMGGFVEENSSLTMSIPQGSGRSFQLIALLVNLDSSCPEFNPALAGQSAYLSRAYLSGQTLNVSLTNATEVVSIDFAFPGFDQNIANSKDMSSCHASRLKALAMSSGDITDGAGTVMTNLSHPTVGGVSFSPIADAYSNAVVSSVGIINMGLGSEVRAPDYIESLSRKPETGGWYGLLANREVVYIDFSQSPANVVSLDALSCPLKTSPCKVPDWIQSVSLGYNRDMVGIDYEGNLYAILSSGDVQSLSYKVPQNVRQISYY